MHKWIIICLSIFSLAHGQAESQDSLFVRANRAMDRENYEQAVNFYEQILSRGLEHPDLYYNLGNGYYRLGIYGQAVWAFEKGLRFSPRDPDIRFNLDITNAHIRDRIEMPGSFFLLEFYRSIKKMLTLRDTLTWGSFLLMLASLVYGLAKVNWLRFPGFSRIVGILIFCSVLIHGVALDKYWELSDVREGVIITREVEAYSAPFARQDAVLFKIHAGSKVEITQSQPEWLEIILLDGKKGWVQASTVREL